MEIIIKEEEEEEVRSRRQKSFSNEIMKNYENTFIEPVRKAINRHLAKTDQGGMVKKVVITACLNQIGGIELIDSEGKKIENKSLESIIRKYWAAKKKALDSNSDRYFKERKATSQQDNLRRRSIGEEAYFDY